jgi:hypothetical protein
MSTTLKDMVIGTFIFCIILFLYLHILFHFKTSNDLEIYEVDQISKEKLEEICDLRQPVIFDGEELGDKMCQLTKKDNLLVSFPIFDVKIKNINDKDTEVNIPLSLQNADKLFKQDKEHCFYSECNQEYLIETGINKHINSNDEFLRPYFLSNSSYDFIIGSKDLETPLRYEVNYRNYFLVTQGSVIIKLTPPINSKYLYPKDDYENFEFTSPINPWNPQIKYKNDFDKIKCLEVVLTPGRFIYIPAYWWYSFKFNENTSVSNFKYRTYMNNIAILPRICLYSLQNQNIERKIAKKMDITELNKKFENNQEIKQEYDINEDNKEEEINKEKQIVINEVINI